MLVRLARALLTGVITSQEISEDECLWLQEVQTNVLKEKGDKYLKQISKELGLFYDDRGILHDAARGRLSNSTLPYSAKYLALLLFFYLYKRTLPSRNY